jgi:hypothetical protein
MPFLTLNNDWSNLSQYYNNTTRDGTFNNQNNVTSTQKPKIPTLRFINFDDGLIRGGVTNATLSSVKDTERVTKFLASIKGLLFVTKQIGLQKSNPKLETEGKFITTKTADGRDKTEFQTSKQSPNQLYTPLSTLSQIPFTAFGGHAIRQGSGIIFGGGYLEGSTTNIKGYNYEDITKKNNLLSVNSIKTEPLYTRSSRLIVLQDGTQVTIVDPDAVATVNSGLSFSKAPNRLLQHLKEINNSENNKKTRGNPVILSEYNGGSNSFYGIGKTKIVTYPENHTLRLITTTSLLKPLLNGFDPTGYEIIDNFGENLSLDRNEKSYIKIDDTYSVQKAGEETGIPAGTYVEKNIEKRVGVSKIGGDKNLYRTVDAINAINIINNTTYYDTLTAGNITLNTDVNSKAKDVFNSNITGSIDGYFGRDIARFVIEFLNNDSTSFLTDVLTFRAYIDDIQDGMTAKWNNYRYMGRGEDFYVYDGFTRDISVAFTMYAHSPEEMKPLYQKLNYLMSTFAPDYSSANKMRGNIAYLTIGDYISRQPGVFTDIKISGFLDTHWEINLNYKLDEEDIKQHVVPKLLKVNLSFKPIHNFLPRKNTSSSPFSYNFILPP